LTGVPREQRAFQYLLAHAIPGDPRHVLQTFDQWCYHCSCGPTSPACPGPSGWHPVPHCVTARLSLVSLAEVALDPTIHVTSNVTQLWSQYGPSTIKHLRCSVQVELIVGPSEQVIPRLRERHSLTKVDFVFMDHWKRCYLRDLQLLESHQLLAEGATVLADNVLFPGAPHFLQYAKTCGKYRCRVHRASLEY
ncbi:TOMT methyltransferase, partial [Chroicocephalus maculipennis]|nr:TOMT methyltransferase [Chroicocephalus maculipennis]